MPTRALERVNRRSARLGGSRYVQRGGVAQRGPEAAGHSILGRQVDFLEELGRDGQAASCPKSPQGCLFIVMIMMQIVRPIAFHAVDRVSAGMVLLHIW
jgi:hypothetical protein